MMKKKNALILSSSIMFISLTFCYLYIAYFNRFASDDYYFMAMTSEKGVWESAKFFYFNWEGAFFGFLYNFTVSNLMSIFTTPFLYNLFLFISSFIFLYLFIYLIFQTIGNVDNKLIVFFLTTISISNLYYNDLAIAEVWYWMVGGAYMIFPPIILFVLALFVSTKNKYINLLCLILFFILGMVRLNYSITLLTILFFYSIISYANTKQLNKKTLIAFTIVLFSILIYLIAPGNYIRHSQFTSKISFNIVDIVKISFNMSNSYFKEYIIVKLHFHLLFLLPTLYIGYLIKDSIVKILYSKKSIVIVFLLFSFGFYVLLFEQSLIMYIAKGGQTKRTLPFINILFTIYIEVMLLYLGAFLININIIKLFFVISILGGSVLLLRRFELNKDIVSAFAKASDERISKIQNAVNNYSILPIDTLKLSKLPNSGWLHSGEIVKYPNVDPMNNDFLKYYFKAKFIIDLDTVNNLK